VDSRNVSRPESVSRSKTPSNVLNEVHFTPVPPEKMELGSVSPDHLDVVEKRRATPAGQWQESDSQASRGGTVDTSPDGRRDICDMEQNVVPVTDQAHVDEASTSRFIRKKLTTGSKPPDEDPTAETPAPSLLPAMDDVTQKERGGKKTYSINMSGAAVPAQRCKKTAVQTPHVNTVTVKGSPLAERKTKVRCHASVAYTYL